MSGPVPIAMKWDGEAMTPLNQHWARRADKQYVVGETYVLVPHEERSSATQRHYFAAVNDGWQSLPEHLSERFPTAEHLRKFALIKAGFSDSRSIVCASRAEALRVAAFIRPSDPFSVVDVSSATVTHYTAKSQSQRAMPKGEFQLSKDAVLGVIAEMIGVSSGDLARDAA